MQVFKIDHPVMAFSFFRTNSTDDSNFAELEADVVASGGNIERLADDLVTISIDDVGYTLPLGFSVVLNGGVGTIMHKELFDETYTSAATGSFDLEGLVTRVEKLEGLVPRVEKLEDLTSDR